ncbi:MAG TPA: PAS domain-containing sensor histidine kinase [Candidatus Acidoferrum sp.]|nr:PAS domain-containing sensor histidine kinase [Candidatus Acidoferrum sp.]
MFYSRYCGFINPLISIQLNYADLRATAALVQNGGYLRITEGKKAESELKMFSLAVQESMDGIAIGTPDGKITYVNAALLKMCGFIDKDEFVGKHVLEFIAERDHQRATQSSMDCLRTGQSYLGQYTALRKDYSEFQVEVTTALIKDEIGQPIGFVDIIRDITEHKNAEDAVKSSEVRFRSLFENSFDAILLTVPNGAILSANPAACRLFGMTEEEIRKGGRNAILVIDDRAQLAIDERERTGKAKTELTFKRKDGSTFEGEATSSVFRGADGVARTSMIIRDLTESKNTELKLREDHIKIEAINEKLRVVGKLTRHDVRNKLSAIRINTYLIKKKFGTNPQLVNYLDAIDSNVASADRLFDLSNLFERIGVEEHKKIEVKQCFDEAVALIPNLGSVRIIDNSAGLVVDADSLLRQVFYNLVDNSLKHGKKVTKILLYYSMQESQTQLFYEDDGVGIPENNKHKLFAEGFSTSNGTGLGLSMLRKILQVYGWTITEEGKPGKGAKFVISIPLTSVSDVGKLLKQ